MCFCYDLSIISVVFSHFKIGTLITNFVYFEENLFQKYK